MRKHTQDFKDKIKEFGRQLDSKITYQDKGTHIPYDESDGTILESLAGKEITFDFSAFTKEKIESLCKEIDNHYYSEVKIFNTYKTDDYFVSTAITIITSKRMKQLTFIPIEKIEENDIYIRYRYINDYPDKEDYLVYDFKNPSLTGLTSFKIPEDSLREKFDKTNAFNKEIKIFVDNMLIVSNKELGNEQLNEVTPVLQSSLLKSVMKELDIDSNVEIPIGTILNYKLGVLIDDENHEYLDFGNYQVYSSEKQEDTNSYNIVAYDRMLNSMKEYTTLQSEKNQIQSRVSESRNLILKSDKEITNDSYQMAEYDLSEPVELNKDYTITIWGNLGEGKENFLAYLEDDHNELGSLKKISENVYSLNFNKSHWSSSHPITEGKKIIIYAYPRTVTVTSTIEKIKLENGINESPEWTIAPEDVSTTFPMTVRDYLSCLCKDINLVFANENDEFANFDKIINEDLYANLGYTYRDILDELAQVTASNIVINDNDELEIRYITDTEDTIDEEYLKDINVKFGQKYGPINSIVLSRAAESDNVYLQDEQSVADNGLCELKIKENQIMNFNDRSDYLPAILEKLGGTEFYINDFVSTGVCYYEVLDKYNVQIEEESYSCVIFNNKIDITKGLQEEIYTDLPEQAETDYTKADKTDRKLNQTTLIVDKQNQQIQAAVETAEGVKGELSLYIKKGEEGKDDIISAFNLAVDQVVINSENFKLDENGNVVALNMNLTGGKIELIDDGTKEGASIKLKRKRPIFGRILYGQEDLKRATLILNPGLIGNLPFTSEFLDKDILIFTTENPETKEQGGFYYNCTSEDVAIQSGSFAPALKNKVTHIFKVKQSNYEKEIGKFTIIREQGISERTGEVQEEDVRNNGLIMPIPDDFTANKFVKFNTEIQSLFVNHSFSDNDCVLQSNNSTYTNMVNFFYNIYWYNEENRFIELETAYSSQGIVIENAPYKFFTEVDYEAANMHFSQLKSMLPCQVEIYDIDKNYIVDTNDLFSIYMYMSLSYNNYPYFVRINSEDLLKTIEIVGSTPSGNVTTYYGPFSALIKTKNDSIGLNAQSGITCSSLNNTSRFTSSSGSIRKMKVIDAPTEFNDVVRLEDLPLFFKTEDREVNTDSSGNASLNLSCDKYRILDIVSLSTRHNGTISHYAYNNYYYVHTADFNGNAKSVNTVVRITYIEI